VAVVYREKDNAKMPKVSLPTPAVCTALEQDLLGVSAGTATLRAKK